VNPNDFSRIFGAGQTRSGSEYHPALHKSVNAGANWTTHTVLANPQAYLRTVAVHPANDNILYVGGVAYSPYRGIVFRSTNGGANWTPIDAGTFSSQVNKLAVDPVRTARIFAGTASGLFLSLNSGGSWTRVMTHDVKDIRINRNAPDQIYVAGRNGVHYSRDGGATWTEFNNGLGFRDVLCLQWDTVNSILYAGTNGGSIYKHGAADVRYLSLAASVGGTTDPAPGTHGYQRGISVSVRAVPQAHYTFSGWSGDLTGTQNPASVVMTTDKSVTANFIRRIYAPLGIAGVKRANRSVFLVEYINVLTWQANPDNIAIAKYRIYDIRGGSRTLLAEFGADVFEFRQRHVGKDEEYSYQVSAVDSGGREGEAATVTFR
jgi:uncharacterized repeat protein (TIGR02543 family)